HRERRALPLAATSCLDAASVQLDQLPHDREPDAETPVRASARAVGLPEALEQLGQERRGDALAAIRDRQLDVRARARQSELDPAPRGCELDGVAEQVPDHLLQAERIAEHQAGARIYQQLEHERSEEHTSELQSRVDL